MKWKRFFLTLVVVFLASNLLGFLIHGRILAGDYEAIQSETHLWRQPADYQSHVPFIWLANLCWSLAFVAIYAKGREDKPWPQQGMRFALWAWLLSAVPGYLISYAIQPLPGGLVMKQIGLELVAIALLGLLTASLYREKGAVPLARPAGAH